MMTFIHHIHVMKFITKDIHALLDYPVAIALIALPLALNLGSSNPLALWIAVGTGIAALILTLFTNHHLGVFRVLPYSFHLAVDALVGVSFLIIPFVLHFTGVDAWFYWINGAAVFSVVNLHKAEAKA